MTGTKQLCLVVAALCLATTAHATTIVASRSSGVAPIVIHFYDGEATTSTATNGQPLHRHRYAWDFGDPTAGTHWDGQSKNTAQGPASAHLFDTPGAYIVTLRVTDISGDSVGSDTVTITVIDPNVVYTGALTTCVNPPGDSSWTDCPVSANRVNTDDLSTITTYAEAGERVLLKRGGDWTLAAPLNLTNSAGPVTIGAYGPGSNPDARGIFDNAPVIRCPNNLLSMDHKQNYRLMDLHIIGSVGGGAMDLAQWLFLRLHIENAASTAIGWSHWNDSQPITIDQMAIVDCSIKNSTDHALYVGAERLAVVGNYIERSMYSHLTRVWQLYRGVYQHNQLLDANTEIDPEDSTCHNRLLLKLHGPDDTFENHEHCPITEAGGCLENYTEYAVVSDNVFGAGGASPISIGPQSQNADTVVSDIIFERNIILRDYFVTPYCSNMNGSVLVGGDFVSIRNNIFDISSGSNSFSTVSTSTYSRTVSNLMVLHNTFYRSDYSNDWHRVISTNSNSTGAEIRNNLISMPQVETGVLIPVADSGTNTVASNNQVINNPLFLSPDNADPLLRNFSLQQASSAIGQADGVHVWEDFYGNPRDSAPDLGAAESTVDTAAPVVSNPLPFGPLLCQ